MGRPVMKEGKRRVAVSLSLSPEATAVAEKAENKSKFVDKSILSMQALTALIADLRTKSVSLEAAMDEIEDIVDIWESEFDETEDYKFKTASK